MVKVAFKLDLGTKKDMEKLCEKFLDEIVKENYEEGFNVIKPYFPVPEDLFEGIKKQTSEQLPGVKQKYGKPIGYTLVKKEDAGGIFLRYSYAQTYEVSVIRWVFIFYKPEKKWLLNSIIFDEKQELLF